VRLAIDATPVVPGRKGLGIFLEGLVDESAKDPGSRSWIAYVDSTYADEARRRWPSMDVRPVRSRPSVLWEMAILPRRARRDGARLVFTGRDRTLCEPCAATVVYLFEVPDHRTKSVLGGGAALLKKLVAKYSLRRFRTVAARVSHFIVSSRATGRDLEDTYGVESGRIHLAYPGIDTRFEPPAGEDDRQSARDQFAQGHPYVLHLATGDPRDNTGVALRSFARAAAQVDGDVALLVAGVPPGSAKALGQRVREVGIEGRTFMVGSLAGEALVRAYQGAEIYLDPTLYEGFGLQLAEAMACGVPVVSSNVTSVPEVVGEAGILLDPHDEQGFAGALERVLSDGELRTELAEKGRAQAELFNWSDSARRILELLEQFSHDSGGGARVKDRIGNAR
jgi:glycosyltransferase involved in cell wall biosynthesis